MNKNIPQNDVIKLYNEIPIKEIAEIMNCSQVTINKILNKNKIIRRGHLGISHSNSLRKSLLKQKETITKLYSDNNSIKNIAKKLKCSKSHLFRVMEELGIKRRKISEARMLVNYFGKNNPNWLNGKSHEPYTKEFIRGKELKEIIKRRDNYTCQECHKLKKLKIHHIDYNKINDTLLNLISLCNRCHVKTNYNRDHWRRYFQMKMFIKELFNPQNIVTFEDNKLKEIVKIR